MGGRGAVEWWTSGPYPVLARTVFRVAGAPPPPLLGRLPLASPDNATAVLRGAVGQVFQEEHTWNFESGHVL